MGKIHTLYKTHIAEGKTSDVGIGRSCTGRLFRVQIGDVPTKATPEELKVSDRVFMSNSFSDFLVTSSITRIEPYEDTWTIWTTTSTYKLEAVKYDEED